MVSNHILQFLMTPFIENSKCVSVMENGIKCWKLSKKTKKKNKNEHCHHITRYN